jgi:hypothetical protein
LAEESSGKRRLYVDIKIKKSTHSLMIETLVGQSAVGKPPFIKISPVITYLKKLIRNSNLSLKIKSTKRDFKDDGVGSR